MAYPFVQAFHDLGVARGPRLAMAWHMAEGGGTVGFLSRANANGVSVHFVIEAATGRIVQMLRLDHMHSSIRTTAIRLTNDEPYNWRGVPITYGRKAALAALGDWADISHGTSGPNHATIGVEVEGFAAVGPNDRQAASIAELAADLGLPANLGHRDFASYKGCPGHSFPWDAAGGHGPLVTVEDPMPQFALRDGPCGTIVVNGPGHSYLRFRDGALVPIDPATFGRKRAHPITLVVGIPNGDPGGRDGYLIGAGAAFVRESDVDFTADGDATDAIARLVRIEEIAKGGLP